MSTRWARAALHQHRRTTSSAIQTTETPRSRTTRRLTSTPSMIRDYSCTDGILSRSSSCGMATTGNTRALSGEPYRHVARGVEACRLVPSVYDLLMRLKAPFAPADAFTVLVVFMEQFFLGLHWFPFSIFLR